MALVAACTRESRCTTSRIHQRNQKNSVPLKEVLTWRRANTSRASCNDATMRARHDARNACAVCIGICQDCMKCLCRSAFFDSRSARCLRDESARESRNVVNGGDRGLRVVNFGKKNIFMLTGMIARSLAPNAIVVANHRAAIRNTRRALRVSHAIGLR